MHELKLVVRVKVWGWIRAMVEFGKSSAFRGWVLGYGFGVRGRKVIAGAEKASPPAPRLALTTALGIFRTIRS